MAEVGAVAHEAVNIVDPLHKGIDADAARLLAAHGYERDGQNFRRGIKPHEERPDQYLAKKTAISISQLEDRGLANRGRPLSEAAREQALMSLRDLIAKQA